MLFLFEKPELLAEPPKFLTPETSKQIRRIFDMADLQLSGNQFKCLFPAKGQHFTSHKNDFPRMDSGYIHPDYHSQITHLLQEIDQDKPSLIITFGKVPFTLLTGQRLSEYRGTLCPYKNHWILPTLDIPTMLKDFGSHPIVRADLNKAKRFLEGIKKVKRQVHIVENISDLDDIKPKLEGVVAIDVETKDKQITCVSFSPSPSDSYVLPIWNLTKEGYHQWAYDEELKLWEFMFDVLTGDCRKVFHNGIYDISYFTDHGIPVALPIEDTMLLHHSISPEMQKSLGFLGSLYCDEAAWKTMNKKRKKEKHKKDE